MVLYGVLALHCYLFSFAPIFFAQGDDLGAQFLKFSFIKEPSDFSASKDQKVVLDCTTNFPDAKVSWRKDGQPIQLERSGGRLSVLQNGSLSISSLAGQRTEGGLDSEEGFYQCYVIVQNQWTFVSRKAKLNLSIIPRFEDEPENKTVTVGDIVQFPCRTSASPPVTYVWYRDNIEIDAQNNRLTVIPVTGTLEIRYVQSTDQGSYKCKVEKRDVKYRLSREGYLRVKKSDGIADASELKFIAKPVGRVAKLGDTVVLECAAVGSPEPQIQWLKDNTAVSLNDRLKIIGQGTLLIQNVRSENSGSYTCIASGNDESVRHTASIVVSISPSVVVPPKNILAKEATDVEFDCKTEGQPAPSVVWLKNGELIIPSDYFGIDGSKLKIFGLIKTDAGIYQCIIDNDAGSAQASAQLLVQPTESASGLQGDNQVPSEPLGLKVTKVTSRSVTLSWDSPAVSRGGPLAGYSIFYKQDGLERERVVNVTNTGQREFVISKMSPNSNYFFRIVGYNKNGPGISSALLKVKTEEESSVPATVRNFQFKIVSPTSVEFRWDPPEVDSDSVTFYKIFYSPQTSVDENTVNGDTEEDYFETDDQSDETEIQVKDTFYVLHGLLPYTEYECRLEAVNAYGSGLPSDPVVFRTFSDVPSGPPRNVSVIPTTTATDAIIVRWVPPLERHKNGPITGYKIRYKTKDRGSRVHTLIVDGPTNQYRVTGLDTTSVYTFRVAAMTVNGTGPNSHWVSSEFSPSTDHNVDDNQPLGPPTSLRVDAKGTEIHVSWTPPLDESSSIREYMVGWGVNVPDLNHQKIPSTERYYVIKNLLPNREYVISLRAISKIGNGFPIYETVRTSDKSSSSGVMPDIGFRFRELKTPVEVHAVTKNATTIALSWTDQELPVNPFGQQRSRDNRYYNVSWSSPAETGFSGNVRYVRAQRTSHMFNNLRPYSRYEFAVKVVLDGVESEWSMTAINQTHSLAPTSAPTDLTIVQASDNPSNVIISWIPPKRANGIITKYVLYYSTDKSKDGKIETVRGDRLTTTIENLTHETEYYFKIQAMNIEGYGPISSPVNVFRTGSKSSGYGHRLRSKTRNPDSLNGDEIVDDTVRNGGGSSDSSKSGDSNNNSNNRQTLIIILAVGLGAGVLIILLISFGIVHCRRRQKLNGYTAGKKSSSSIGRGAGGDIKPQPPDLWIHHDHALELRNNLDKNPPSNAPSLQDLKQLTRRSPTPPIPDVPRYHALSVMGAPSSGTLGRNYGQHPQHNYHHVSSSSVDAPPHSARGYPQKAPQIVYTGPKGSQPRDGSASPFGSGNVSTLTPTPPPQVPLIGTPVAPPDYNSCKTMPANSGGGSNRNSNPLKSFTVLTTPPPPPPIGYSPAAARVHSARSAVGNSVDSPRHKVGSGVVIGTKARALQQQQQKQAFNNGSVYSSDNAYSSGKDTDSELPRSCSNEELNAQMRNLDNLMQDLNAITANDFDA